MVLSAPSGAGKTTISNAVQEADGQITQSISVTTRQKRPKEADGVDYTFVTEEAFKLMIEQEQFLEYARVFTNFYGTLKSTADDRVLNGQDTFFDVDWQGYRQIKSLASLDVVGIFILPPSKKEVLRRLKTRNQDTDQVIQQRIKQFDTDIMHWQEYDYVIVNETLENTVNKILEILHVERLKKTRQFGLENFINCLIEEKI